MRSWRRVNSGAGDALRGDRWATHRHEERWWKSRACASSACVWWPQPCSASPVGAAPPAAAQPLDVPTTYGGDLWTRPRLSGDWFGFRDEIAKKGVTFDIDLLLAPQRIVTGGRDTGSGSGETRSTPWGRHAKLGLWPGGFLNVHALSGFGTDVLNASGAIVPVSTPAVLPRGSTTRRPR